MGHREPSSVYTLDSGSSGARHKSTQFQFADSIGFGLEWHHFQCGYRFTHISNLDIKTPNPSLDFHQLSFGYLFIF